MSSEKVRALPVLLFLTQSGGRSAKVNVSKLIFQQKLQFSSLEIKLFCTEKMFASGTKTYKFKVCVAKHCNIS
jgi:hypothetical protein